MTDDPHADAVAGDATPEDATDDPLAPGTVSLVGSGPGDPELLTVKARRRLAEADVVLHDKLPGPEILGSIPAEKREDVGKRAGGERTGQEYTNDRLVELAEAGKAVVRLKGGDPFVFGRGGEEAEHLAANGIPFEVVPGVTSPIAAPAAAGIPVTHRDHASSVSFVTGHEDPTKEESAVDWDALAATGGTVVDVRDEAGIEPPAITVIGEVAAARERVLEFLRGRGDADTTVDLGDGTDTTAEGDAEGGNR